MRKCRAIGYPYEEVTVTELKYRIAELSGEVEVEDLEI